MNFIFKLVFGIAILATLWFGCNVLYDLWIYWRLDQKTSARVEAWDVREISSSQFAIEATYCFVAKEKEWKGKTVFQKPYHLNRPSVEKALKEKSKQPQMVWYNLSNPKFNSLERIFPYKKCFYTVVSLGVLVYYLGLNYYLASLQHNLRRK